MDNVKIEDLLGTGAHFGHLTRKWNPKFKPYVLLEKNGIHIIDLESTEQILSGIDGRADDVDGGGE